MKKYINYFLLFLVSITFIFILNDKISDNIQNVKTNFDKAEISQLKELSSNISNIIKKHINKGSLYKSLKAKKSLKRDLEYMLEVVVSKKYKYSYVVQRAENDRFRFLLDGNIGDKSILGEPFFAINKAWQEVYKGKKPITFKEDDLESIWMTYLYPIVIDGKIDAILAIDFSKEQLEETVSYLDPINQFINYIVVGLYTIILLLLVFITLWYKKNKESIKRKEELEKSVIMLIEATDEAKASSKAKSEFLANMSHEIRTPMNAIVGFTDLVLKSALTQKQHDYISKVQLSSESLLTIINDILDFSKIEAGKMEFEHRSFMMRNIATKVEAMFETQSSSKNLIFEVVVDEKLPQYFLGDIVRIEQVVINLLSNAFKFTKSGSVKLSIDYKREIEHNICIKVEDSGIGIPKEKLQILFESFSQADNSTTREYGGTGLGLSISKQIINLLGGEILVSSVLGEGTVFTINMHLDEDLEVKTVDEEQSSYNIKDKIFMYKDIEVLIAEDNLINQDVIKGYLEEFDFNLNLANNGQECLDEFKNKKYDLILMDINMPVMGGYEATKLIREIDKSIPILALSANARGEDYEYSKEIGMNAHISKPIDPNELYATLERNLPKEKLTNQVLKSETKEEKIADTKYNFNTINSEKVLKNFNQNHKLYKTILTKYHEQYNSFIDEVDLMDMENLKESFHKFKSITGTIGAEVLFDKVKRYYDDLMEEKNDQSLLEDIKIDIKLVNLEVGLFLEQFEAKNNTNQLEKLADAKLVDKILEDLKSSLKRKKSKLIKASFKELEDLKLSEENSMLRENLKEKIASYNYAEALKYL